MGTVTVSVSQTAGRHFQSTNTVILPEHIELHSTVSSKKGDIDI